jgi:uncharacterized protein (TIGR03084 family)
MMQQALDLLEEGTELKSLLDTFTPEDWTRATPFKNWTINNVVQHLHGADKAAMLSMTDEEAFMVIKYDREAQIRLMNPKIEGEELLETWWNYFNDMCKHLGESDPKRRVPWFGPDMGVMMFATARQMETWAHGQDIYDLLRVPRVNSDRLKNIAVIGVRTYGWTFVNRKMEPPSPVPYVKLDAPSGEVWEFGDPSTENYVAGSAVEFCHVVTQGRNINDEDIHLEVVGEPAEQWMAIAQCFAGPPEDPPAPGIRTG